MNQNREEALTLEILAAIEARNDVTQRHLADRLGVALGLANSYLKRCVRKGFVKITQAPANRYLYYLTPHGFAEKSRLTAEYFTVSFDFYRRASDSVAQALGQCVEAGAHRIVLLGVSELAEIASVRAHDFDLEIVGTLDPGSSRERFAGKPVWHLGPDLPGFDIALYTALPPTAALEREVVHCISDDRMLVPGIVQPLRATIRSED